VSGPGALPPEPLLASACPEPLPRCAVAPGEGGASHELAWWWEGWELLAQGAYRAAHEPWEQLWKGCKGDARRLVHALIHLCACLHHASVGNLVGSQGQARRGLHKLAGLPDCCWGLTIQQLAEVLEQALAASCGPEVLQAWASAAPGLLLAVGWAARSEVVGSG
jgi:Domain of unknown function (DUF309)